MDRNKLRKLTFAGLFTALITVATIVIRIPTPTKGYVNFGDVFVNTAAWVLGPAYGSAAAGIGSALADMAAGYVTYAPATLIIKAGMAFVSCMIFRAAGGNKLWSRIAAASAAEVLMVLGYFGFEAVLYGSAAAALPGIPGNLVQGLFGAAASVVLYESVFRRITQGKE